HEGEDNVEYMTQNLDLLVNRFRNKNPNVQASTLKVYKSRLKSSLEDFQAWRKDCVAWEKSILEKAKALPVRERKNKSIEKRVGGNGRDRAVAAPVKAETPPPAPPQPSFSDGSRRISFPIRHDFNLEVAIPQGGITSKELLRLVLFLYPYCKDGEQ